MLILPNIPDSASLIGIDCDRAAMLAKGTAKAMAVEAPNQQSRRSAGLDETRETERPPARIREIEK